MRAPAELLDGPHGRRLEVALDAVRGAGAALLAVRGQSFASREAGDQLKTSFDEAAEGWVLGFLRGSFPDDLFLAEEAFERSGSWPPSPTYWTVDALDGTRSYVENFDGFCVQVAFVEGGEPVLGAICAPAEDRCFLAARGRGAWVSERGGGWQRLQLGAHQDPPRFVDSVPPSGAIGDLMRARGAHFVECGSFGLKLCRVAEGRADVFAKAFRWKLWDVAPGDLLVREAGGRVGLLGGGGFRYDGAETRFHGLLAAAPALFDGVARALREESGATEAS